MPVHSVRDWAHDEGEDTQTCLPQRYLDGSLRSEELKKSWLYSVSVTCLAAIEHPNPLQCSHFKNYVPSIINIR